MDLISILTTVILATTIGTVIVGVAAYAAFKLRDKRKPKAKAKSENGEASPAQEAVFLKPYDPTSVVAAQPAKAGH
jgi:heme/copper-type cytochrome/quinol oxidase subunit 2